jgi:flagellar motor switch protein FliN/FliY
MSVAETTQRDALLRLGASTAEAIAQVLEMFAPGEVTRGDVTLMDATAKPFSTVTPGSVAASVSYVDGVTGANVFLAPPSTARALAVKMGVSPQGEADDQVGDLQVGDLDPQASHRDLELSELELSAISEASNQMMAAAANAISMVLGQEVQISPPTTQVIENAAAAADKFGTAPHVTSTAFSVAGEPCRLIQLVPNSFVVRVARALDEMETGSAAAPPARFSADDHSVELSQALTDVNLRVWAELGRTELALGEAVSLPLGGIVELDRATEAPVDLFVNGLRFARGRLLVSDEGRWLFALDELATGETVSSLTAPSTV